MSCTMFHFALVTLMATLASFLTIWRPFCLSMKTKRYGSSHASMHSNTSKSLHYLREKCFEQITTPKFERSANHLVRHQSVFGRHVRCNDGTTHGHRARKNGRANCIAMSNAPTDQNKNDRPSDKIYPI